MAGQHSEFGKRERQLLQLRYLKTSAYHGPKLRITDNSRVASRTCVTIVRHRTRGARIRPPRRRPHCEVGLPDPENAFSKTGHGGRCVHRMGRRADCVPSTSNRNFLRRRGATRPPSGPPTDVPGNTGAARPDQLVLKSGGNPRSLEAVLVAGAIIFCKASARLTGLTSAKSDSFWSVPRGK